MEIHSLSAITHLLENAPSRIRSLVLTAEPNTRIKPLLDLAKDQAIRVERRRGGQAKPESPLSAVIKSAAETDWRGFLEKVKEAPRGWILALDHIQDPQNFGALVRTAEGLGALGVLVPKDRSCPISPAVFHASAGAVGTISVVSVPNLSEVLRRLKESEFWIVGSTLDPSDSKTTSAPWQIPDFEKSVLVLGAEGPGISSKMEALCDWRVRIPLQGKVQSLNVSAAGAALMYELSRPRRDAATPGH